MAKKAKRGKTRGSVLGEPQVPLSLPRDWPLAVVALIGLGVTGVLLWGGTTDAGLPYCSEGSGCEIVQNSAWSRFLGLPLALWGFFAYLALAASALQHAQQKRRRYCALIATSGFLISVYLTGVSGLIIGAYCTYCLTSLALMTMAILLSLRARERPGTLAARLAGVALAVVISTLLHASATGAFTSEAQVSPELRGLALHLAARGWKFYGASWCPHCQQQKDLFGGAAQYLPYVECAPHGPKSPRATECELRDIKSYPTWLFGDRRIERILAIDDLAKISGFKLVAEPPTEARPD